LKIIDSKKVRWIWPKRWMKHSFDRNKNKPYDLTVKIQIEKSRQTGRQSLHVTGGKQVPNLSQNGRPGRPDWLKAKSSRSLLEDDYGVNPNWSHGGQW